MNVAHAMNDPVWILVRSSKKKIDEKPEKCFENNWNSLAWQPEDEQIFLWI